ncbi:fimbria/pilus outer membrane usher protein [Ramlibacter sp. AN1133]|uniref:fimbria/pilus outer membrane usher protein n=1 Tax=Ramlibacter sp. AN1133 TaxID=3133429 RepID=UPI0030C4CFEB
MQLRIDVYSASEPVLAWSGTAGPGPYPLALIWSGASLHLSAPLPILPSLAAGPVQSMSLRNVGTSDRLEMLVREPVYPKLRHAGSTWVLELEPEPMRTAAPPDASGSDAATATAAAPQPPALPREAGPVAKVLPQRGPSSVAGDRSNPAAAASTPHPEQLLVDLTVNGLRQADIARAEQLSDGRVLLAREDWQQARLVEPGEPVPLSDGTPGFALDAIAGLRFRVDRQRMAIDVEAPASAFAVSSMDTAQALQASPARPSPGALLNYDFTLSHPLNAPTTAAATLEAVGFGRFGTAVTSALASKDGERSRLVRLDSYWQFDTPESMHTLVLGDTVGVAGGWSRPVRYGGLRWGRDFGLRPGFVTMPLPSLRGEAALPSTVDLLVNDSRRFSQSVGPGPFDIRNVPVITGAGEMNLVVRDLLGRQTVLQQSYYASPRLLARGLSDFSLEGGWMRTGFGAESQYGTPFGAATLRRGITPGLTGEGRLELQRDRQAAGVEVATLIGTWGVGRMAMAASRDRFQETPERGALVKFGIERSTARAGGALQYEYATRGFAPLGESRDAGVLARRSREQVLATIGGRLWGPLNAGLSYVRRVQWSSERISSLGLTLHIPLGQAAALTLSASRRLDDGGHGWSGSINLNVPLGGELYTSARVERPENGHTVSSVIALRNPPAGPGLGWRAESSTEPRQRARGGLQYNTNHGDVTVDVVADAAARVSTRASARGTVGMMAGLPFASRPVGQGSFAVVQVQGVAGVPIKRSNQVVAVTDDRGLAFVPGLVPWNKNVIEIDAADLPLDAEVQAVTREVVPYARSGALVHFDVRRTRQALLVLHRSDGQPAPLGARVRLLASGVEFEAGRRGEVWLTDLTSDQQRVVVSWPGGGCELDLRIPPSEGGEPITLEPLVCDRPAQ